MIALQEISKKVKQQGKFWIAFTGDSLTSCEWVHPNWREIVEYVLKEELTNEFKDDWKPASWGVRTFNFAYDGATTKDILGKVHDILKVSPDLVISLMGGNDPVLGISVEDHRKNIEEIVAQLKTKVVWCTSTPANNSSKNEEYRPYAVESLKIPQGENLQIIDLFTIYRKFPLEKFFTFKSEENPIEKIKEGDPDYWHPNQLGNAYIAKVILKETFAIDFGPEKYISETLSGEKYPGY